MKATTETKVVTTVEKVILELSASEARILLAAVGGLRIGDFIDAARQAPNGVPVSLAPDDEVRTVHYKLFETLQCAMRGVS